MKTIVLIIFLLNARFLISQWEQVVSPHEMTFSQTMEMAVDGNNLYFAGSVGAKYDWSIFKSTDFGLNWTLIKILGRPMYTLAVKDSNIFVGGPYYFMRSTDYGNTWQDIKTDLFDTVDCCKFSPNGKYVFVGVPGKFFLSSDNGNTWINKNNGLTDSLIMTIEFIDSNIVVGSEGGIFFSTNNGDNWVKINNGINDKHDIVYVRGSDIFACGLGPTGIFKSTNIGKTWSEIDIGVPKGQNPSFSGNDKILFVGTLDFGLFYSIDEGKTWQQSNGDVSGFSNWITTINFAEKYVIVGTMNQGIFRAKISDLLSGVKYLQNIPWEIITYPNPASNTTTLKYILTEPSEMNISISNTLGETITRYSVGYQSPGEYSIPLDFKNQPSGIHYYRLQAGKGIYTGEIVHRK